jgi:hypothetical protein
VIHDASGTRCRLSDVHPGSQGEDWGATFTVVRKDGLPDRRSIDWSGLVVGYTREAPEKDRSDLPKISPGNKADREIR